MRTGVSEVKCVKEGGGTCWGKIADKRVALEEGEKRVGGWIL